MLEGLETVGNRINLLPALEKLSDGRRKEARAGELDNEGGVRATRRKAL